MDTVTWVVLIVIVLVAVAAVAAVMARRRRAEHTRQAEHHRAGARQELDELRGHHAEAEAAEERAEAKRREAERAEREAQEARVTEQAQAARAEDHVRTADRLDPSVDHRSDDYEPGFDRATRDETDPTDHEADRPAQGPSPT